jgi:hypothetical protein
MSEIKMYISELLNGLFGPHNEALMGKQFIVDPGVADAFTGQVSVKEFGESISLAAAVRYNNIHSNLTITATPIDSINPAIAPFDQYIQMKLTCVTGNANFGYTVDPTPPPVAVWPNVVTSLTEDILIDCNNAVVSLTAASQFSVKIRHVSKWSSNPPVNPPNPPDCFPVGFPIGPRYRIIVGYSYGTPKSIQNWYTDLGYRLHSDGVAFPNLIFWARPQFAEAVTINFVDENGGVAYTGNLRFVFIDNAGTVVHVVRMYAPFGNFPLVRWPQKASYVGIDVTNVVAPIPPASFYIAPVHAIRI